MVAVINHQSYPPVPRPTSPLPTRPWHVPPPAPVRPHGAWYVAPAGSAVLAVSCVVVAGVVWAGVRAGKSLHDTTTYGDGSAVPPSAWNDHQGTVDLWLLAAAITAVLAVAGFVGLAVARGRCRREQARRAGLPG
ncbi:hypothetical protein ACFZBU_23815 [Embleya sp. NPDC008237]|uniref:hypothetical protein n=1 Tax=Embleya sp. NPDC008237 TaxID=3363978 RepID=UPI0036E795CD